MAPERTRRLRCAIYTRKSSEEGLEQSFNSLDAQREACAAYVQSQRHEGWKALESRYDDGGYSGGSMDRPALQALLRDLEAGKVDVVVVYKVDRLTRSLADFAKMVELFDRHRVSFVSVTQQFNTTSSMGRLTLNVLLSFAQFEREVTGERIRDKIAASKKRGMWMGGYVPLGYDLKDRKLLVNKAEAELVRRIYDRYLALGCVRKLRAELIAKGVRSKVRTSRGGRRSGGVPYSCGALYEILKNRLYLGEIAHKGAVHPGEHEAIVKRSAWEAVQARLQSNSQARRLGLKAKAPSLLAGLLFDAEGSRFTPVHTTKNGKRYRYYASQRVIREGPAGAPGLWRIPAHDIENLVLGRIQLLLEKPSEILASVRSKERTAPRPQELLCGAKALLKAWPRLSAENCRGLLCALISKITVYEDAAEIRIPKKNLAEALTGKLPLANSLERCASTDRDSNDVVVLRGPARLVRVRGETHIVEPTESPRVNAPSPDPAILKAIARGQCWYEMLASGKVASVHALARATGVDERYLSRILRLAFLAPDVVERLIQGRHARDLTVEKLLRELPIDWKAQRSMVLTEGLARPLAS